MHYIFSLRIQVLYLRLAILSIGPVVISQEEFGRASSVFLVSVLVTEMVGGTVTFRDQVAACPGGVFQSC